ncbi:uncharacterized protein LOC122247432 [Penaeus japonicus]|uniref:uncharacterized protein LOC122247432 n=1 Tax=Penaeus japonicus TaxID=27405 RepID=UPI001C71192F|nr:uncharacterized protein LOC122247432 [Penaeus japonicus]XP_042862662.1 uncharacterized protein LOC122247432 [Penaeus japonicus]
MRQIWTAQGATIVMLFLMAGLCFLFLRGPHTDGSSVQRREEEPLESFSSRLDELEQKIRVAYNYIFLLYCDSEKRVLPNGGYCLNEQDILNRWNAVWDGKMCASLEKVFRGSSVLDMGAGRAHYGRCFLRVKNNIIKTKNKKEIERMDRLYEEEMAKGGLLEKTQVVRSWTGYDGALNVEDITGGFVHYADLSQPIHLGQKYDWVLSLEVGEHIPKNYEANYVDNLVRHACKGIVVSWAVIGQAGHHHINNQPMEYVQELFESRGLLVDEKAQEEIRENSELKHYKHVFVFRVPHGRTC